MKRKVPGIIGVTLAVLGTFVIAGWLFHVPAFISLKPNYINMVFNTALCFILSGSTFVLVQTKPQYQNQIYTALGAVILLISGLTFIEYTMQMSFGIDELFVNAWLQDTNPFPGRMAVNTSIGFMLTGLCFVLFPYANKQPIVILIQLCIFSIMLLGISALLGYVLKLEFLYGWYQYTRMAIHTAIGISLLSIALWTMWSNCLNFSKYYQDEQNNKIILLNAMIVTSISGIAMLSGYTIAARHAGNENQLILLILTVSIFMGIALLYWQIHPLILQLMAAKKSATENSDRLQAILNHAAEGIITIDSDGTIESLNPAGCKMFGYQENELIGKNLALLIPQALGAQTHTDMTRYLTTNQSKIIGGSVEVPGLRNGNQKFLMEFSITKMHSGKTCKFVGIMHDISERKLAEEKLLENEERFRSAFDYSPVGMGLVSLEGRWLKVNKALCDIVGHSEAELLQIDFQSITHPDDLATDLAYVKQLHDGVIPFYRMEKRYIRKDKKVTWILLIGSIIRNEQGVPLYYIGQIQDINDKKKMEEELSYKAYYDSLTGLMNRAQLENLLNHAVAAAHRNQRQFSLFFIDLDHFKEINDTFGHDVGDEVLKIIGDRLRACIRKTDIAARLGGDEFILVPEDIKNHEAAAVFAKKILQTLLKPIMINKQPLTISASIGISNYPADGHDGDSLKKSADLALYKAKKKGRNNYHFCLSEMNDESNADA